MKNETKTFSVKTRTKEEKAKNIINDNMVPCVLYGAHVKENLLLKVDRVHLEKTFKQAGESTLLSLEIDGKDSGKKVLIKDLQKDPVKNDFLHLDLYEVNMKEPIHAMIHLNFVGESLAVDKKGGSLLKNMDEIEVKCLPGDLVNHIDIDISSLNDFGQSIKIADIKLPEGMEVLHEKEETIAIVLEPKEEKEPEAPVVEGEAGAEGEEAKADEGKAEEKAKAGAEGEEAKK
ncbi:50S ribosomal protein L25 [Candidatus Falkowbacteria bacterium]|nr:50S ribosomal protein L25 [Candidatus Falkowbacteria bacterium]